MILLLSCLKDMILKLESKELDYLVDKGSVLH
ncbi:hypothetical protein Xsze_04311 [Xenorhabdus szentirmaii DSM 16338]|nr:hypothetical protein Xsze_04311 [Xenorhabdus szentirmaii DSM 16338]